MLLSDAMHLMKEMKKQAKEWCDVDVDCVNRGYGA
jgi:hypothetical protein